MADASNKEVEQQIAAVVDVLSEIGINEKDTLLVLNKIDRIEDPRRLEQLKARYPEAVGVSAVTGEGIDKLALAVSDALSKSFSDVEIEAGVENGKLVAYLAQHGEIISKRYGDERLFVHCRIPTAHLGRLQNQNPGIEIRPYDKAANQSDAVEDVA